MNTKINFYDWLDRFKDEPTPLGGFVQDTRHDKDFPKDTNSMIDLVNYLDGKNACDTAITAARDAFIQYKQETTGLNKKEVMFEDIKNRFFKRTMLNIKTDFRNILDFLEDYGIDTEGNYEAYNPEDDETIIYEVSPEARDLIKDFLKVNTITKIRINNESVKTPLKWRLMY